MGQKLLGAVRGRVQPPKGIPVWMYCGAGAFAAFVLVVALIQGGSWLPVWLQVVLALVTLAPWIPGIPQKWMPLSFVLVSTIPTLVLTWTGGSPLMFSVLALSAARVAISSTLPASIAYALFAAVIVIGRQFVAHHDFDWVLWKTYLELGLAFGYAARYQRLFIARSRQAREEHARLAAMEERRRIARDVHDVLAHTLTILMVQLNSARLTLQDDPEAAGELLDQVSQHGRHCLVEIRKTVGLLSEPDRTPGEAGPIDGARGIEELVASYRNAGVEVDLRLDVALENLGRLATASNDVWKSGYRIVQEALANATKHAPGSPVKVRIAVDDAGMHMTLSNALQPGVVMFELPSGGHGLRGMRERVAAVGGEFSAGLEGNTWVVRVELPLCRRPIDAEQTPATLGRAS